MRYLSISLLAMFLVSCGGDAPPPAPEGPRSVRVEEVFASGGKRLRTFSGSARAGLASRLSFRVSGTLTKLPVKLGDRVKAGQTIAVLDDSDYQLQVDDAEASLRQAEAQSRNASANYARIRGLYENNRVSINDLDAARAGNESAQAQVQSITKKLELARSQLSYAQLKAPLAGTIAEVTAEINENVRAGQAIAVLNAGSEPEVTFSVPEQLIKDVREGAALTVRFGALPDQTFDATVTEVGVASGALATTYPVVARLKDSSENIRPDMAAEISLVFGSNEDKSKIFVKPKAVVEDQSGQTFVFLAKSKGDGLATVEKRNVKTGDLTQQGLEVLEGLQDGDPLITAGLRFLSEGMEVKVPKAKAE